MAFAPGDVVILKSGGQALTVAGVDDDGVECLWMGDNGELHRETIPAVVLAAAAEDDEEDDDEEEDD